MTTPQNPGRRRRQKIRRTKQLNEWRAKQPKEKKGALAPASSAKKTASK